MVTDMIAFPLRTERLLLSPLDPRDREVFLSYRQDPQIARWQSWDPDYSAEQADALLAGQPATLVSAGGQWLQIGVRAIEGELLGDVAVHSLTDQPGTFEIGVTLARSHQGHGFAREAVRAVSGTLFLNGAHRVIAQTDARNVASARIFEALGFRHEARHVEADWFKGEWTTLDVWALLHSEPSSQSMATSIAAR